MKKLVFGLSVGVVLVFASTASAQGVTVVDPTSDGSSGAFTGQYACYDYVEETLEDPGEYDANGNQVGVATGTHNRVDATCTQEGYVYAGTDGVILCNGNPDHENPDGSGPLVGYVWVGPDHAASNPVGQSPGGEFGAGNNHEDDDGNATGDSPCP